MDVRLLLVAVVAIIGLFMVMGAPVTFQLVPSPLTEGEYCWDFEDTMDLWQTTGDLTLVSGELAHSGSKALRAQSTHWGAIYQYTFDTDGDWQGWTPKSKGGASCGVRGGSAYISYFFKKHYDAIGRLFYTYGNSYIYKIFDFTQTPTVQLAIKYKVSGPGPSPGKLVVEVEEYGSQKRTGIIEEVLYQVVEWQTFSRDITEHVAGKKVVLYIRVHSNWGGGPGSVTLYMDEIRIEGKQAGEGYLQASFNLENVKSKLKVYYADMSATSWEGFFGVKILDGSQVLAQKLFEKGTNGQWRLAEVELTPYVQDRSQVTLLVGGDIPPHIIWYIDTVTLTVEQPKLTFELVDFSPPYGVKQQVEFKVKVLDPSGFPLPGVGVSYTLTGQGGGVLTGTVFTDAQGLAPVSFEAPYPGTYTFTVSARKGSWQGEQGFELTILPSVLPKLTYEPIQYWNKPITVLVEAEDYEGRPASIDSVSIEAMFNDSPIFGFLTPEGRGKYTLTFDLKEKGILEFTILVEKYGYISVARSGEITVEKPFIKLTHNIPAQASQGQILNLAFRTFNPQLEPMDVANVTLVVTNPHDIRQELDVYRVAEGWYAPNPYRLDLPGVYYFTIKASKFGYEPAEIEVTLTTTEAAAPAMLINALLTPIGIVAVIAVILLAVKWIRGHES